MDSIQFGTKIVGREFFRILTGNLLTEDQIKSISSHAVGRHFADLFPENMERQSQQQRLQQAQLHIEGASSIIGDMNSELESQKETLNALISEIEQKKSHAQKYAELAKTNEVAAAAIKDELETAVRAELTRSSQEGRWARRSFSAVLWIATLIAGAALGNHFEEMVALMASLF